MTDPNRRDVVKFLLAAPLAPFAINALDVERASELTRETLESLAQRVVDQSSNPRLVGGRPLEKRRHRQRRQQLYRVSPGHVLSRQLGVGRGFLVHEILIFVLH